MEQNFSPNLAANAVASVVQMYSSILIDSERREKLLLAQLLTLQAKLNLATTKLKEHGILVPGVTDAPGQRSPASVDAREQAGHGEAVGEAHAEGKAPGTGAGIGDVERKQRKRGDE